MDVSSDRVVTGLLDYIDRQRPQLGEILEAVCAFYEVSEGELIGTQHDREIAFARQMFCYLANRYTKRTLVQIARRVHYCDHTMAHYGVRRIGKMAQTLPLVRDDIDVLRLRIAEKVLSRGRP
jgi:chromosomal replication initiation ATPase DnaA